jgi:hypothetical protein
VNGFTVWFGDDAQPTLTFRHPAPKSNPTIGLPLRPRRLSERAGYIGDIDAAAIWASH